MSQPGGVKDPLRSSHEAAAQRRQRYDSTEQFIDYDVTTLGHFAQDRSILSRLDVRYGRIGYFDGVVPGYVLEHIYPHEVPVALSEFLVLVPGGMRLSLCPIWRASRLMKHRLYRS